MAKRYAEYAETLLGAHTSIAGGVRLAPLRGQELGCTAIQIFLKNAIQWKAKPYSREEINQFKTNWSKTGLEIILGHDTYLINLSSPDLSLLEKSRGAFLDEMKRCYLLGLPYLITHPGTHGGIGEEKGLQIMAESLNYVLSRTDTWPTEILLETTAGQGNAMGYTFEQFARIIELVESKEKIGICLDTCHIFAAGYALTSEEDYLKTMSLFDLILGFSRLKALHLNDSKAGLNSHIDRHEHIGLGQIGTLAFKLIMSDPRFHSIPKIIETPKGNGSDRAWDKRNLALLRSFVSKRR